MRRAVLRDLEERIEKLTQEEQLWLIERLARKLRRSQPKRLAVRASDLAAMAADPQIQAELRKIEEEFSGRSPVDSGNASRIISK
jgi:hypothetical protein